MDGVTIMSDTDKGDESNDPSTAVIVGIAVGAVVLILIIILIVFCRVRYRKSRRSSGIDYNVKHQRTLSVKHNMLQISYRRSDDEDLTLRPTSSESQGSYQFNPSALVDRDTIGRPSQMYDTAYSTKEDLTNQGDDGGQQIEMRRKKLSSSSGQVSIISQGNTYDHGQSMYSKVTDRTSFYSSPVNNTTTQDQSGRQLSDDYPKPNNQDGQRNREPAHGQDSSRSSKGVNLNENSV